jgi:hypothetical protein
MVQLHVSKDPSNQLSITLAYNLQLATNLIPQPTKQFYFAYNPNRIPWVGEILRNHRITCYASSTNQP